jgi:hypothetical protein
LPNDKDTGLAIRATVLIDPDCVVRAIEQRPGRWRRRIVDLRDLGRAELIGSRRVLWLAVVALLAVWAFAAVAAWASPGGRLGSSAASAPSALGAGRSLTARQLSAALLAGARTRKVPPNLQPSLSAIAAAKPIISTNGCHLLHPGVRSKPCVYGDRTAASTVVLFGDSHASAWFPALDLITTQQHWRLVDLTKDGCPPAVVDIAAWFRHGAPYWECTQWRTNAIWQIAAIRPALVILSEATYLEYPEARPIAEIPTGYGSTWLDGLAATFEFLTHAASHVLFISDVPTQAQRARPCLSAHPSDVQACDTSRSAAILLPSVKAAEIQLAGQDHVNWLDPTSWFCTPTTCPVIAHNIVVYRDNAHMTPEWSTFLTPVLADAIRPIMQATVTPARRTPN